MLDAWGIKIGYRVALQAEMVSMLAKYLPGGVWTPAARTVALRKYGGRHRDADDPRIDPGRGCALSAISGVVVFVVSLAWVRGVDAPLLRSSCLRSFARSSCTRASSGRLGNACSARSAPARSTRCRSR